MIKGVVFDFDGVLVDSPPIYFHTMKSFLSKHGLDISDAELSRMIAFSMKQEFEELCKKYSLKVSFEEFIKGTLVHSKKIMEKELLLHQGALGLLAQLHEKGVLLALASNNNRSVVQWALQKFRLEKFFEVVVPVELVSKPKPAPDIYLKSAELLGLSPFECVGIEDTLVGVDSVVSAGLKCIAFPNRFSDRKLFTKADLVVASLSQLDVKTILSLGEKK